MPQDQGILLLQQGKKFGKAKAEGGIYVDYEVNQNHSIKEFINLLKIIGGLEKPSILLQCRRQSPWGTIWDNFIGVIMIYESL